MNRGPRRHPSLLIALILVLGTGIGCSKGSADEAPATDSKPAAAPSTSAATQAEPAKAAGDSAAPAPGQTALPAGHPATDDPAAEILRPDQIPDVVARIDGQPVTKDDLLARSNEARGALAQRGMPQPPPSRGFFHQVLDDIIGNRLLYAELSAAGKAASADDVQKQMEAIRGQFPSDEEFDKALSSRGFDRARLQKEVAESLTVEKWVRETVMPSITVSDADKHQFYDSNKQHMMEPEKVHARHILIRVDPQAGDEEKTAKRKQIDDIRAKIAAGADFAEIAKQSSDDKGSGARGGDLGWFARGQMVPSFEQAAFSLEPGKLSDVVETRFGYHLIEVIEKKPESNLTYDEVSDRIGDVLKQRQLEETIKSHVNDLSKKAKIEILF